MAETTPTPPQRSRLRGVADTPWLTPGRLAALVLVLLAAYAAYVIVAALRGLLVTLLVALFLAFAVEPAVQWLANRGWSRPNAAALVFVALAALTAGAVAAVVPLVLDQVGELLASLPRSIAELNEIFARLPFDLQLDESVAPEDQLGDFGSRFSADLQNIVLGAAGNLVTFGATVLGMVFQLFTIVFIAFYLVIDGPKLRRTLAAPLSQRRQHELLAIWELAVAKTGGYILSRIVLASAVSIATAVFLSLLGMDYPIPLAIWLGLTTTFIPVVGTYLGGILPILVALGDEPTDALWVLGFIVVYQLFENYVLAPRVQAKTMDVHPAMAFVALLVGATLLGAVGALLALPAMGIIQALASTYVHRHELIAELQEAADNLDEAPPPPTPEAEGEPVTA